MWREGEKLETLDSFECSPLFTLTSDTTSTILSHLWFHLASDQALVQRLQKEIDELKELNDDTISKIDLLDAAIHETLRLHPAVPSGLQRLTPPQGMTIGNTYVPGNTIVQVPLYTMFRGQFIYGSKPLSGSNLVLPDPRAFESPNEFIAERWTTNPELVKDRSVYIPFNIGQLWWCIHDYNCAYQIIGPWACVGKRLALMELRRVTAELLLRYDISFAPGKVNDAFLMDGKDTFTLTAAPLLLNFTKRQ